MPLIWGFWQRDRRAADWHDGQIAHRGHVYFARRAGSVSRRHCERKQSDLSAAIDGGP
jgi:hypothetical protein